MPSLPFFIVYLLLSFCPQVVEDGYEFFAKRQLVTLFSAPNYCGEFDNAGAMMSVDETLMCSFQVCRADIKKKYLSMAAFSIIVIIESAVDLWVSLVQLKFTLPSLSQILKPADKKLYPYGGGAGLGSGRPVTPPRNSAKSAKNKK